MSKMLSVLLGACLLCSMGFIGCPTSTSSVEINNNSNVAIVAVHISPTTSPTWGTNWLEADIPAGSSFTITNIASGLYDLRAEIANGDYWEVYNVSLNGASSWDLNTADLTPADEKTK